MISAPVSSDKPLWILTFIVFFSRLPCLFLGYGSEEDAWGLILIAKNIAETGVYEVSRMPGHPLQELLLSLIWHWPSWIINLITAIVSTIGVFFFMKIVREWSPFNYLFAGIILAFTPIFYINSVNVMDYTWALTFSVVSLYFLIRGNILAASTFLAIACGFRITSGGVLIPMILYMYYSQFSLKDILRLTLLTPLMAAICYLPPYLTYGLEFFMTYTYFPYPSFFKNIYKATFGAWGIIGVIAVSFGIFQSLKNLVVMSPETRTALKPILILCFSSIILFTISFIGVPQKSAFVIPLVPFLIIFFMITLHRRQIVFVTLMMLFSGFLLGINLDNPIRGSKVTSLAFKMKMGDAAISIDLINGPLLADMQKRMQKIEFARKIADQLSSVKNKTLVIAGWWQNEINYFLIGRNNPYVKLIYYEDYHFLKSHLEEGYRIYFLPEQNYFNDLRFRGKFTDELSQPFQ